MEQDFTKGLSVCIGNYGYYNEGDLHDTWITLPKTEAEIRDFLHLNRLQDPLHEEIYISDYDGVPFGATQLFTEFCQLEDLNLLAKQLVTVSPDDLEKVVHGFRRIMLLKVSLNLWISSNRPTRSHFTVGDTMALTTRMSSVV